MTHLTATYPTFQSEGLDQLADGDSVSTEFNFRSMGFYLRMESFNNKTILTIKATPDVSKQTIDDLSEKLLGDLGFTPVKNQPMKLKGHSPVINIIEH